MTVYLQYIKFVQFSIKLIYEYCISYHAGIMVDAFSGPVGSIAGIIGWSLMFPSIIKYSYIYECYIAMLFMSELKINEIDYK